MMFKRKVNAYFLSPLIIFLALGCSVQKTEPQQNGSFQQEQTGLKHLTFLATNDVHGHIDPNIMKDGSLKGGLEMLGAIVRSIRQSAQNNPNRGIFLVDAGDQFQGTLLSNTNEGALLFKLYDEIGYDAVVPGNHDYDFGPINWMYDRVVPGVTSRNPREVIETLASSVRFPLISANTYYKTSVSEQIYGQKVDDQCRPVGQNSSGNSIDYTFARRPKFLKPYTIVTRAGVRVAFIGIDNTATHAVTTRENVEDLCFRDEAQTYLEVQSSLKNHADVFILVMHAGNSGRTQHGTSIVRAILERDPDAVHAVFAGHTHAVHDDEVMGVRIVQDGANAEAFGRVDLIYDPVQKKVMREKTASLAGIGMHYEVCDSRASFCLKTEKGLRYENVSLSFDPRMSRLIQKEKAKVAPIINRPMGNAPKEITRHRTDENELGNFLSDQLIQTIPGSEVALMNAGGIRENIKAGHVTYNDLFTVLPFNNLTATFDLEFRHLFAVLAKSYKSCGDKGILNPSGLKIRFSRNCSPATGGTDHNATIVHIVLNSGEVLYDKDTHVNQEGRVLKIITADFLADGGDGYEELALGKNMAKHRIMRDMIADQLSKLEGSVWNASVDGRLTNIFGTTIR